jgi:hypothetical protein
MLVSSCDYTFVVERPDGECPPEIDKNWVRVDLATSIDGFGKEARAFWWDPQQMADEVAVDAVAAERKGRHRGFRA